MITLYVTFESSSNEDDLEFETVQAALNWLKKYDADSFWWIDTTIPVKGGTIYVANYDNVVKELENLKCSS